MREILFRGKRVDNGEWMYGYLVIADERYFIATYPECITSLYYPDDIYAFTSFVEVIPSTVGQFTGLTDKNGKKIFEGDIIYCESRFDNANMVVIFECGQFRLVLSEKYRTYQTNMGFYYITCFDKEVIGNIHDNPELLKGGVDNG